MRIEFDIIIKLGNSLNQTLKQTEQNFYELLRHNQIHGKLDNLINTTKQMIAKRIQNVQVMLDCPDYTIESLRTMSCGLYF